MMNLKILEQENPPLSAIREIAEGGEEALGALVRLLEPFVEETADGEPPDYFACEHALRILAVKQDPRVVELAAAVIDYHTDDEWDLEIINTAELVLESVPTADNFETLWALFRKYEDGMAGDSLLRAAASCRVPDERLRRVLRERFDDNPSEIASVIDHTLDAYYLPILEACLRRLAPYVNYLPLERMKFPEVHEWIEVGAAWLTISARGQSLEVGRPKLKSLDEWYHQRDCSKRDFESTEYRDRMIKIREEVKNDQATLQSAFCENFPERFEDADLDAETRSGIHRYLWEIDRNKRGLSTGEATKLGRNEPCHCGSGKKFKKCCNQ